MLMFKLLWDAVGARFAGFPVVKVMAGTIAALCLVVVALWWRKEAAVAEAIRFEQQLKDARLVIAEERRKRISLSQAVIDKAAEANRINTRSQELQTGFLERIRFLEWQNSMSMAEADRLREQEREQARKEGRDDAEPLFDIRGIR